MRAIFSIFDVFLVFPSRLVAIRTVLVSIKTRRFEACWHEGTSRFGKINDRVNQFRNLDSVAPHENSTSASPGFIEVSTGYVNQFSGNCLPSNLKPNVFPIARARQEPTWICGLRHGCKSDRPRFPRGIVFLHPISSGKTAVKNPLRRNDSFPEPSRNDLRSRIIPKGV